MKKLLISIYILMIVSMVLSQQVVRVEAGRGWQATDVSINAGETILFLARGAWNSNFDWRPFNWWGPSGRGGADSGDPLATAPGQALIGKIGSNGVAFEIGSYMVYGRGGQNPLNQSGSLYLRINDQDGNLGDNTGTLFVAIFRSDQISVATVEANVGWQKTGIEIIVENSLFFFTRGAWSGNVDDRAQNWWGPTGRGTASVGAPLPDAPGLSVIGKIGQSGVPFEIGSYMAYGTGGQNPLNQSGPLYLRINNSDASLGDNQGKMVVTVIQSAGGAVSGGLVAYYPFDGNANDESGNGYQGVIRGAELTTDRNGISNKAFLFDGNSANIKTGINLKALSAFTMNCWVLLDANAVPHNNIVWTTEESSSGCDLDLYCNISDHSGVWRAGFQGYRGGGSDYGIPPISAKNTILTNSWTMITCVKYSSGLRLYVNSILTDESSDEVVTVTGEDLWLGTHFKECGWKSLKGKIDEVRIYDRALTDGEIQSLFQK